MSDRAGFIIRMIALAVLLFVLPSETPGTREWVGFAGPVVSAYLIARWI